MRRYLLLASVAGCLLNVGNAWAETYYDTTGEIGVSAKLAVALVWLTNDVDFGNIILSDAALDNDILATFTNGAIEYTSKVFVHGTAKSGVVGLSSGSSLVTGITFDEEVELTDAEENVVAKMINIAPSTRTTVTVEGATMPGYYINGSLQLIDYEEIESEGEVVSGTMTATLAF